VGGWDKRRGKVMAYPGVLRGDIMAVNPIFFVEHNLVDRIDEVRRQVAALSGQMDIVVAILSTIADTQKSLASSVMIGRILDLTNPAPTWEDECEAELRDMKSDFFFPDTTTIQQLGRTFDCNVAMDFLFGRDSISDYLEPISGLTLAQLEALFDILLDTDEYLDVALVAIGIEVDDVNFCDVRRDLQTIFDLSQCIRCWVWAYTDTIVNEDWYCIGCHAKFDQQGAEDQGKHLG